MGFFCKCLSSWDNLELAQPTALQWVKAALCRNWCRCAMGSSGNQIPFRKALWGPWEVAATTGLKTASGEQLHSHSTASKEFLLLGSVCSVAWIPGSGTQLWAQPFGNYMGDEQQGTSRAWDDTRGSLQSRLRLGVLQKVKQHYGYFFSTLKSRTIPAINNFVPKKKPTSHP